MTYGYSSFEFSMDTFMLMGLLEAPFFIYYASSFGYSNYVIMCGLGASIGQIVGTILMIYAATKGLAGPSSAMV